MVDSFVWAKQKEGLRIPMQLSEGHPYRTVVILAVVLPSLKFP